MRARTVYESINFERGQDPKDALQIGEIEYRKREKIKEELRRAVKILVYDLKIQNPEIKEIFNKIDTNKILFSGEYKNKPCRYSIGFTVAMNIVNSYYAGVSYANISGSSINHYSTLYEAMNKIRSWSSEKSNTNESVNFERGIDPIKSMGIGLERMVKDYKWDNYFWKSGPEGNRWYKLIRFIDIIDWRGIPILVMEVYDKSRDIQGYMATSDFGSRHKLGAGSTFVSQISPEAAVRNYKRKILKDPHLKAVLT